MGINHALYNSPAVRGDISGTVITASIALGAIADALDAIRLGKKPDAERIAMIRKQADRLHEIFDELTGYTE